MPTSASPRNHAPQLELDALRGIGCMLFFTFHFQAMLPGYGIPVSPLIDRVSTYETVLALHLFFAISGYILFGSLERLREIAGPEQRGVMPAFYVRRFFRIVPLWWLVLTIELFRQHLSLDVYVANATFLFGFLYWDPRFLPIIVSWTLFTEEFFYLLVPTLFRRIRTVLWSVVFVAATVAVEYAWMQAAARFHVPNENDFAQDFPFNYFKFFAVGILARFVAPKLTSRWSLVLDVAALAAIAITAFTLRFTTVMTFVVLLAVLSPGSLLKRCIVRRPLVFLGAHCYFIYIAHEQLFLQPALDHVLPRLQASWLGATGNAAPLAGTLVIALTGCIFAAFVTMRWFEAPMMAIGKKLSSTLVGPVPSPVATERLVAALDSGRRRAARLVRAAPRFVLGRRERTPRA